MACAGTIDALVLTTGAPTSRSTDSIGPVGIASSGPAGAVASALATGAIIELRIAVVSSPDARGSRLSTTSMPATVARLHAGAIHLCRSPVSSELAPCSSSAHVCQTRRRESCTAVSAQRPLDCADSCSRCRCASRPPRGPCAQRSDLRRARSRRSVREKWFNCIRARRRDGVPFRAQRLPLRSSAQASNRGADAGAVGTRPQRHCPH